MRRIAVALSALGLALLCSAPSAGAAFGLKELDVTFTAPDGTTLTQAGAHPFTFETEIAANTKPEPELPEVGEVPEGTVRDLTIGLIPGLAPNQGAVPTCSTVEFLESKGGEPICSASTKVGTTEITIAGPNEHFTSSVYNLVPPPGVAGKIGFTVFEFPVTIEATLSESYPYNVIAKLHNINNLTSFYRSHTTIWGVPADPAHDKERGGPASIAPKPFFTLPRACTGPLETFFEAFSWQGDHFQGSIPTHDEVGQPQGFTDCAKLGFSPTISARPTSKAASSPTGLDVSLDIADEGLENPTGLADSDLKKVVVTLPEGMTANPSVAEGLEVCSEGQLAKETAFSAPGAGCPEESKIGTVEVETPLLEGELLRGSLFIAKPYENPFKSLLALYMTIKEPALGIGVKVAGKVEPDPKTGQLVATFGDPSSSDPGFRELPQLPFSHFRTHFREGGRSPLISPPGCGSYQVKAELTPWSGAPPITTTSSFEVISGPNGSPCPPGGTPPFEPGFQGGTVNSSANQFSPLQMRFTRRDGDQDLTKLSATLAPGLAGILAGISSCPETQIALAKSKTGLQELASPSCPQSSEIGRTTAGAGVGSQLTYVPGRLYLAGPYHGAPFSVVSITPAVAGPFDVGAVVVRFALQVNSQTAVVTVDGAASDPIPHILAGIPLAVRDLRAYADRPKFIFNPTNCDPFAISSQIWGGGSDLFSAADDSPVSRSVRFQAANCASLGFKPSLKLSLKGGTKRGDHPALKAVVTPRFKDANFQKAVVTLPRSAFLDQAHIRTICTRVQFAAHACPPGAVYGSAKATTPILDEPVEGPVYLRSSNHNLPDLVMALKGPPEAPVDVEIVGRIDSHKGGIRGSFETIPDLPVSNFVLNMQGGKKGLIVNSRNLCAHKSRANAKLTGQNNARYDFSPLLRAQGCSR
jgi:hypothetical protein